MGAKYSMLSERDQTYLRYANRFMENQPAALEALKMEKIALGIEKAESKSKGKKEQINSPYDAAFAKKANSGLSFGWAQNDVHSDPEGAGILFKKILIESKEFKKEEIDKIVELADTPGVTAKRFKPEVLEKINKVLNQRASDIDILDEQKESRMLKYVNNALERIGSRGVFNKSDPNYYKVIAAMGHWCNQTGNLDGFTKHFSNMKKDPAFKDIDEYLQKQKYFRDHPGLLHKDWLPNIDKAKKFANDKLEIISNLKLESLAEEKEDKTREANNAVKLSDSDNVAAMSTKVELMSLPDNAPTIAVSKIGILQKLESNNLNQQNDAESDNNITPSKDMDFS